MRQKLLIMCLCCFLPFSRSHAQNSTLIHDEEPYLVFCEIVGTDDVKSTKQKVKVAFGEKTDNLQIDGTGNYVSNEGKTIKFCSMVDAMNYMSLHGWFFVQAYVIHKEHHSELRWILKKLSVESAIFDGFKTKK